MTGGTHILAGAVSMLAADQLLNVSPQSPGGIWLLVGLAAVAALLPDIDSDNSQIRQATRTTPKTLWGRVFGWGVRAATGGHRGATHSLLLLAAVVAGSLFIPAWLGWPLAIGYASHLAADLITPAGLPLLWPLSTNRVRLPRPLTIRTGSIVEFIFAVGLGMVGWGLL